MTSRSWRQCLAALAVIALAAGCTRRGAADTPRGFILINLSGLRADLLQSSDRGPSPVPHLAAFSRQGLAYERSFAVSSDPLAAEVSLLSGLYPQEHGAMAPDLTLSSEIVALPERLAQLGYRTAAFTNGGYAGADFGVDRGFDEFTTPDPIRGRPHPVFGAALEHLRQLGDDRFFLYLHPNDLHGADLGDGSLGFPRLAAGFDELTPERLGEVRQAYDGAARRLDAALGEFLAGLDSSGLRGATVVLVTADRGFELGEHGRVGHTQLYPENLRVPLVLAAPGVEAGRSRELVQTVDVTASLFELAGPGAPATAGRLLPGLPGAPGPRAWGAADRRGRWSQSSLLVESDDRRLQLIESRLRGEYDGTWVTREVGFDTEASVLAFSIVSYLEPRTISVEVDGIEQSVIEAGTEWADVHIELPPLGDPAASPRRRVRLSAPGCASPADSSESIDRRCLSFKVEGLELSRSELFDLEADPEARRDLSFERPELHAELVGRFSTHRWLSVPPAEPTRPGEQAMTRILASGEYPEPPRP